MQSPQRHGQAAQIPQLDHWKDDKWITHIPSFISDTLYCLLKKQKLDNGHRFNGVYYILENGTPLWDLVL